MKGLSIVFIGTLFAIPIVGTLAPDDAVNELGKATAQVVLAFVAVIEFLALSSFFTMWRRDIQNARIEAKEHEKTMTDLISQNTVAIQQNKDAFHRHSNSTDGFKDALAGFTEVIRKCEKKG